MYEENKADARKKLEDEERVRRMKEGGEDMRDQIAMEEAQPSQGAKVSGLTPEEEERRRMLSGAEGSTQGLGETQQAEMAMWGKEGKENLSEEELRLREQTLSGTPSDTDSPKTMYGVVAPAGGGYGMTPARGEGHKYAAGTGGHYTSSDAPLGKASSGGAFTGGPQFREGEANREAPTEGARYAAGTGSNYPGKYQGPMERASSGESFTGGARFREETAEGAPREDRSYAAGTGGHYPKDYNAPGMRASTGESFTSGARFSEEGREPPYEQMAQGERGRMGEYPTQEATTSYKVGAKAATAGAMVKDTGSDVYAKSKEYGHRVTDKAKEFNESGRAEDMANRAGESIGRALRKAVVIGKEMTSGLRKGLNREKEKVLEQRTRQEGAAEERWEPRGEERESYGEEPVRRQSVEHETYVRETSEQAPPPTREARRKEGQ